MMSSGVVLGRYLSGINIIIDIIKFDKGPASATIALSLIGFLKLVVQKMKNMELFIITKQSLILIMSLLNCILC